jgi:lipopolysaccharide transport system permease protein
LTAYISEVWHLRHFWLALVRNDLRTRYRRSMLGLGWSLLQPISMTIIFCVVFSALFHQEIRTFAPYLLSGLVFWGFVSGSVHQGCQCFLQGESYIRQHRAPLAIHALRVVLGAKVHFLIGLAVVLVFVWIVNGPGNLVTLLSLLPALAVLLVLAWSLAVVLGVVNVLFQDTQHLVEVGLQMLFYLTPIMYPADLMRKRNLGWFIDFNPLAALLELVRAPILYERFPSPLALAVASVTVLAALAAALPLLRWAERRIIMYL